MLAGAWAALVVAVAGFLIGFVQGGVVLLYVAIASSAAAMALVVGYLLRRGGPADRRTRSDQDSAEEPGPPGSRR